MCSRARLPVAGQVNVTRAGEVLCCHLSIPKLPPSTTPVHMDVCGERHLPNALLHHLLKVSQPRTTQGSEYLRSRSPSDFPLLPPTSTLIRSYHGQTQKERKRYFTTNTEHTKHTHACFMLLLSRNKQSVTLKCGAHLIHANRFYTRLALVSEQKCCQTQKVLYRVSNSFRRQSIAISGRRGLPVVRIENPSQRHVTNLVAH